MADYVNREALIDNLELLVHHEDKFRQNVILGIVGTIRAMKSDDVAPVIHSYWKRTIEGRWECSNCGAHENPHTAIKGHYCWRCGAKMDLEE